MKNRAYRPRHLMLVIAAIFGWACSKADDVLIDTAGAATAGECQVWEYKQDSLDGEESKTVNGWEPVGGSATAWDASAFKVLLRRCVG